MVRSKGFTVAFQGAQRSWARSERAGVGRAPHEDDVLGDRTDDLGHGRPGTVGGARSPSVPKVDRVQRQASGSDSHTRPVVSGQPDERGKTSAGTLFLHIMKTAGHEPRHAPRGHSGASTLPAVRLSEHRQDEYWKIDEIRTLTPRQRSRVRAFHGHFPYFVAGLVGADTTLTILRDPVERADPHQPLRLASQGLPGRVR